VVAVLHGQTDEQTRLRAVATAGLALRGHEATYCLVDPPCGACNACTFNAALVAFSGT
jgi:hypothetical protein